MMPVNLNAQARPYELTKINSNMMNIYDVNGQKLDILQGISKGNWADAAGGKSCLINHFLHRQHSWHSR